MHDSMTRPAETTQAAVSAPSLPPRDVVVIDNLHGKHRSSFYLAFSIFVIVNWPLMRSGTKRTLSPGLTALSMAGSAARKNNLLPSPPPKFLTAPPPLMLFPPS